MITPTILAPTIAEALVNSLTPLNILSGFKKCGIHPLNPGEVIAKAVHFKQTESTPTDTNNPKCGPTDASQHPAQS